MGSPFREPTEEEKAKEQELIDAIYKRFVEIVAEGRPGLDRQRIEDLATGEIFLGEHAKKVGLIDELGSIDDAIAWAAERAEIPARPVFLKPKRSIAQMLFSRSAVEIVDSAMIEVAERFYSRILHSRHQ